MSPLIILSHCHRCIFHSVQVNFLKFLLISYSDYISELPGELEILTKSMDFILIEIKKLIGTPPGTPGGFLKYDLSQQLFEAMKTAPTKCSVFFGRLGLCITRATKNIYKQKSTNDVLYSAYKALSWEISRKDVMKSLADRLKECECVPVRMTDGDLSGFIWTLLRHVCHSTVGWCVDVSKSKVNNRLKT